MTARLYRPEDADAVQGIFAAQGLAVDLPLPEKDPAVILAMVGERAGRVEMATILRMTAEAHLVVAPAKTQEEWRENLERIRELQGQMEGAAKYVSKQLRELRLGALTDAVSFVPVAMPRMVRAMPELGWIPEPPEFQMFYRKIPY